MGDVEVETGLVDEGIHLALGSRPHRIDTEMHDALLRQPFGGGDVHAGIVARIFLAGECSLVMTGAEQDGAAPWYRDAGLRHRRLEIGGRNLGGGRQAAVLNADVRYGALLQPVVVARYG